MKMYEVRMTMAQAKEIGLWVCKHCGYPENNHFDFGSRQCAHNNSCPGFEGAMYWRGTPLEFGIIK